MKKLEYMSTKKYVETIPCTWQPTPQNRRRFTPEACYKASAVSFEVDSAIDNTNENEGFGK